MQQEIQYDIKYWKTLKMVQEKQNSDKLCNKQIYTKNLKMIKSKTKHRCNSDLHTMVGFNWFYIIVPQNFTRSANRLALLFILVPLVETELAENITFVMKPPEKKN